MLAFSSCSYRISNREKSTSEYDKKKCDYKHGTVIKNAHLPKGQSGWIMNHKSRLNAVKNGHISFWLIITHGLKGEINKLITWSYLQAVGKFRNAKFPQRLKLLVYLSANMWGRDSSKEILTSLPDPVSNISAVSIIWRVHCKQTMENTCSALVFSLTNPNQNTSENGFLYTFHNRFILLSAESWLKPIQVVHHFNLYFFRDFPYSWKSSF